MKTRSLILFCAIATCKMLGAREFTDTQGRKLNADIVGVTGEMVSLVRVGEMRPISANITLFSNDDQLFIREWAETNLKYNFEVSIAKEKVDETKQKFDLTGSVRIYTTAGTTSAQTFGKLVAENEKWIYKVNVKNRLPTPLSDLRVDFWCFRRKDWGQGKQDAEIAHSGTTNIQVITSGASTSFETGIIELHKSDLQGFRYADGTRSRQTDSMGGIVLRIFDKKGREVHAFSTDQKLLAKASGNPLAPPPPLPLPPVK